MNRLIKLAGRFSPAFLFNPAGLHPVVKLLSLIIMIVCIPQLSLTSLAMLCLLLLIGLMLFRANLFLKMMLRMRWLFVSMWLIYAFTTPGEYLHDWPIGLMPTYEGLRFGLIQVFRISLILAGVAILMASSTKEKLMAGIYQLIRPFEILGIPCKRFTARLYLTLEYIENTAPQLDNSLKSLGWLHRFESLINDVVKVGKHEIIHLENTDFSMLDYICLALLFVLLGVSFGVSG